MLVTHYILIVTADDIEETYVFNTKYDRNEAIKILHEFGDFESMQCSEKRVVVSFSEIKQTSHYQKKEE